MKKTEDKRLVPLAKLLCKQWDDDWCLGKVFHTDNAKEVLKLMDGIAKCQSKKKS